MNPPEPHPSARESSAALWAALAAGCLLLFWIADGARIFEGDRGDAWHHYEYLVDGFLHGHTSLSVQPAPGLLALRDPYDPAQNAPWRLWDASLYHGKFYLYFGPTPALLMLPWQVLTGHPLPQRLAVAAFAALGLAGLALLFDGARRRHFARVSAPAAAAILLVALCASWLPVMLRRPDVWELPIAAECACLWWGLYFLWRCLGSENGGRWALAVGASVALMMGSRPTSLMAGAAILLMLLERGRPVDRRFPTAAAVAVAGGLVLLAYNYERFGRFLEFGQSYQLWGSDERGVTHFSLRYFTYDAWVYLFAPPALSPYFPFVLAVPPGGEPAGHLGIDEMHGALFAVPVQLASIAALAWAWRNRRDPAAAPLLRVICAAALASLFAACILFCFAGAVSRYTTELLAGATVASSIGLLAVFGAPPGKGRRALRLLAACAGAWTVAYAALASAEQRIFFKKTNPQAYGFAAHLLDYPSLWASRAEGASFGPVSLTVRVRPTGGDDATVILSSGRPGMVNQLILLRTDPGHARLVLAENYMITVDATPIVPIRDGTIRARVEAPWLYPPPQHPWWDAVADPGLRCDLQTRFLLEVDGHATQAHTPRFFDATGFQPAVAARASHGGGAAWVESLDPLPVPDR